MITSFNAGQPQTLPLFIFGATVRTGAAAPAPVAVRA
jgi:hypothetical protein